MKSIYELVKRCNLSTSPTLVSKREWEKENKNKPRQESACPLVTLSPTLFNRGMASASADDSIR
jgi:hypothetical protein